MKWFINLFRCEIPGIIYDDDRQLEWFLNGLHNS